MKIRQLKWNSKSWEDYEYWQQTDKKKLKRINQLIKDIKRSPFSGIGKPEKLKFRIDVWSRRIDIEHRLTYQISGDTLLIVGCRFHYD